MRKNAVGDIYCSSATEVLDALNESTHDTEDVYLAAIDAPSGDETKWCGEVCDSESGETLCFIEADSEGAVKAIAQEAEIEDQS